MPGSTDVRGRMPAAPPDACTGAERPAGEPASRQITC